MKKRQHALSAECLSVNMPKPLAAALAKAAEARAMTMASYMRNALFDRLERDGVEVRSGATRSQPLPAAAP